MIARSNAASSIGSLRRRRDLDLDQHTGLRGRFLDACRGLRIGDDGGGAARESDLAGDGGEADAVRTADLDQPVAHLHAGHADDECE